MVKTKNNFSYLYSSIITAVVTKTSVSPITRLKVLQQTETYYGKNKYNKSLFHSVKNMIRKEGYKGLFKGNLTNIAKSIPNYCIKFPLNDFYLSMLMLDKKYKTKKDIPYTKLLGAGIFTGVCQTIITYPLDLIRTRITQEDKITGKKSGIIKIFKNTIKNEGYNSLYKGIIPSLLTTPLYIGIQLSLFQNFKKEDGDVLDSLISGAAAGVISQSLMYPGDTVKRQLQLNGMNGNKKFNGLIDCISYLYCKNGLKTFYRGLPLNTIKSVPEIAIKFSTYEYLKKLFNTN